MDLAGIPTSRSPDVLKKASRTIAEEMTKEGVIEDSDTENFAATLERQRSWPHDGCEFAKLCEDEGWGMDASSVEMLDGAYWTLEKVASAARKEWLFERAIINPYPLGTRVRSQGRVGRINRDEEHYNSAGFALVKFDDDPDQDDKSSRVIAWERLEPA